MAYQIAIIEDDNEIARIEELSLRKEGYAISLFSTGGAFLESLKTQKPDLILLDLMLPDIQGLDLLRRLRSDPVNSDVEVIIVSAKGLVADKVEGLDYGADDYLEKPFSVLELASRVNARFRRRKSVGSILAFHGYSANVKAHTIVDENQNPVDLTPKEWDLLMVFLHNPNSALSREMLFSQLWGQGEFESRALDVHVVSLRKKLKDSDGKIIETVYGVGYRLNL